MATPLLQQARQRKMIYFGAIVALFTLSLVHREFIIKPQATRLQLRETVRGEVELTSSAVRLMLTGSRGLAVTVLWYNAMDKQRRHEWHELELIVKSITKLQPYFITPWLFQGWNIAFNVSVECDRPRDKYYHISRGIELLAEGERRNSGTADKTAGDDPDAIPGNPELRQFIGFVYQLKIGNSDERLTMRSLLELSCIDPIQRNPDRFWTINEKGQKVVKMSELAAFTQKNPRLMRRLQEQLDYSDPQRIVQFLQDNQQVPNRFKPVEKSKEGVSESELKHPLDQFPILPPFQGRGPNSLTPDLTPTEAIDVFLVSRTWFEYSQKPLPPPEGVAGPQPKNYDKLRYRVPKNIVTQLFRQHPMRAQIYIAEVLTEEGFFDGDGWDASDWFRKKSGRQTIAEGEHRYGSELKYHASLAWRRGHETVRRFGEENGIYVSPYELGKLNKEAEEIRKQPGFDRTENPDSVPEWNRGDLGKSLKAAKRVYLTLQYKRLTNYDSFFYQSQAESDPIMILARKKLFQAERKRTREVPTDSTLDLFNEAWELYVLACLRNPNFAQLMSLQEDAYETQYLSLGLAHKLYREKFKNTVVAAAKFAYWPAPTWQAALFQTMLVSEQGSDQQQVSKVFPIRNRYGRLDMVQYFDGRSNIQLTDETAHTSAPYLQEALFRWTQGATLSHTMSFAATVTYPGHEHYLLTRSAPSWDDADIPERWLPLISGQARGMVFQRMDLRR